MIATSRNNLSISPAGRSFAAGPRAESSDSAFEFQPKGVARAFPSDVLVAARRSVNPGIAVNPATARSSICSMFFIEGKSSCYAIRLEYEG
jgi:hypothetical protein